MSWYLKDAGSEAEILQAINAGKTVIAHTDPVSVPGYTGAGYIIFDPLTGDGAYKIGGGGNGGLLYLIAGIVFGIIAIIILLAVGPFGILGYGWMMSLMGVSLSTFLDMNPSIVFDVDIFIGTTAILLDAIGFIVASVTVVTGAVLLSPVAALLLSIAALATSIASLIRLLAMFNIDYWIFKGERDEVV